MIFHLTSTLEKKEVGGLCVQCASVFSQATFDPAQI